MEAASATSDTEDKEMRDTEQHASGGGDNRVCKGSINCDMAPKAA